MTSRFSLYMHAGKRGEAEKIRMLACETGMTLNDVPITDEVFAKMVEQGDLKFQRLPALIDHQMEDTTRYIEGSNAIMMHIASEADKSRRGPGTVKYFGPEGEPWVHSFASLCTQFEQEMKCINGKGQEGSLTKQEAEKVMAHGFASIEAQLSFMDGDDVRTDGFIAGSTITYADVAAFAAVNACLELWGISAVRKFTKVKEFHDKMAGRPGIEKWLSVRTPDEH